jgi:hypothetical protein
VNEAVVDVRPFHGSYPGLPDLFHLYCSECPDFGFCGEAAVANAMAAAHRAKHRAEKGASDD